MSSISAQLTGTGAAYLRVSTDRQDTERQIQSIRAFADHHGVKIAPSHWMEDAGWERDADRQRPEFNRLLQMAKRGEVRWIVVDRLDRFGTKGAKRLFGYLADLEDVGCRLFDASGKEWTGEDDATELTAWLGGRTSMKEQREKSYRCLTGMVLKARAGEWQGGPPKLGFDVGCFDRKGNGEQWRVIFEGREKDGTEMRRGKERPSYRILRSKVYPDGRTERLDGNVVFRTNRDTEVMRIVPTNDPAKLAAARGVFTRFATESVTFFDLAKWLNNLGIRNSFGGKFQSRDVSKILVDEAYLGYPTFSKRRSGRFHRHDSSSKGGVTVIEAELRGKDTECVPSDVIKSSVRHFEPLVDRATWDAVQRKVTGRVKVQKAPRNPELYLSGLVVCAGCGTLMVARTDRMEYYCGSWDRHRVRGALADCPCLRNGVRQSVLEGYVGRYLEDVGQRLALLVKPDANGLTGNLEGQATDAWGSFSSSLADLLTYLEKHHRPAFDAMMADYMKDNTHDDALIREMAGESSPFVEAVVKCYRATFDPADLSSRLEALEGEHTALMQRYADLPTPRAKDKAKRELEALEARITDLEKQQADAGEVVEGHYRQMTDLQRAVHEAREAMQSEDGALALRQRAQALRGILCRIECEFVATGKHSSGPGQAGSRLASLTFVPVAGDTATVPVDNVGFASHGNPYERDHTLLRLLRISYVIPAQPW